MKTLTLKILMLSVVLTGCFFSCKDNEEYPIEIPFTEYSLENTSCQWKNLNYDENVIVINSNEELGNYITCADRDYPEIDFSKNTLLLASGIYGPNQAYPTAFFQNSINTYTLETTVVLTGIAAVLVEWNVAALVPKISHETNIVLTLKFKTL